MVVLALLLRLVRAGLRWDEIALAYAAYQHAWVQAFVELDVAGMLTRWVGLHPPLYSLLFGLTERVWGAPLGWLLLGVLASTGAVWLVGRAHGVGAALVLAVDPLQLAYTAEVNNYPLLVLMVAGLLHARARCAAGGSAVWLAVWGLAACWTHLLGGLVAGFVTLTLLRRWREALAVLVALAVGSAPLVAKALALMASESTFGQAGLQLDVLWHGLDAKLGAWIVVWGTAGLAALRWRQLGFIWWASGGAIVGMLIVGVAAAHQQPYWLVLGPPGAVLAALALRRGVVLVGLGGLVLVVPEMLDQLSEVRDGLARERGIDAVLEAAGPRDAIWLLAPALKPDDDKTATSDVLWRLPPWRPMPAWQGRSFEFADYGFGQPRLVGERVVHTTTDLWREQLDAVVRWHLADGRALWFVLYDHGPANAYDVKLQNALRPYVTSCSEHGAHPTMGPDLVCRVEAIRGDVR